MTEKNIKIQPSVIKALRENSGYSINDIAKILVCSSKEIEDLESGKNFFTLTQIKKLSEIYKRPLAAFFSEELPKMPTITDYRINRERNLTKEVFLAERRAYYLAGKIAELNNKKSEIPTFPDTLNPNELAKNFREYLNLKILKNKKPEELLSYYKHILEEKLSILIIEYPLKADDVRAFSLLSDMSIIVLNEQDEYTIKLFSLFHEIYHLLKKKPGICSIEVGKKNEREFEHECDLFSAEFLVPLYDLSNEVREYTTFGWEKIIKLSGIYGVSKQVIMLRLLWSGHIKQDMYMSFKEKFNKEKFKSKKFGRRNWEKVFFNRVGNLAIKEVSYAYKKGDITFFESAEILNTKTKFVEKFIS